MKKKVVKKTKLVKTVKAVSKVAAPSLFKDHPNLKWLLPLFAVVAIFAFFFISH